MFYIENGNKVKTLKLLKDLKIKEITNSKYFFKFWNMYFILKIWQNIIKAKNCIFRKEQNIIKEAKERNGVLRHHSKVSNFNNNPTAQMIYNTQGRRDLISIEDWTEANDRIQNDSSRISFDSNNSVVWKQKRPKTFKVSENQYLTSFFILTSWITLDSRLFR